MPDRARMVAFLVAFGGVALTLPVLVRPITAALDAAAVRSGTPAGSCGYLPPNVDRVVPYAREHVRGWYGELPESFAKQLGLDIDRSRATLRVATPEGPLTIEWELEPRCTGDARVTSVTPRTEHASIGEQRLQRFVDGFPAGVETGGPGRGRATVDSGGAWRAAADAVAGGWTGRTYGGPLSWAALLLLAFAAAAGPVPTARGGPWRRGVVAAAALGALGILCLYAAWPMLELVPVRQAALSRMYTARVDPFGDPGHPFLPLALISPFVAASPEPESARLMPLLWLVGSTALVWLVTARRAGAVVGLLAGAWLVCEVRRRHALLDVSDWDLAGLLLLAQLAWLQRAGPRLHALARRDWIAVALLFVGGALASWIMLLPSAALLLVVGWHAHRGAGRGAVAFVSLGLAMLLGLYLLGDPTAAASDHPRTSQGALTFGAELLGALPVGRDGWMVVPVALGLFALWRDRRDPSAQLAFLFALSLLGTVLVGWWWLGVGAPRYTEPLTPLLAVIGGWGVGRVLETVRALADADRPAWRRPVWGGALAGTLGALALVTLHLPAHPIYEGERWGEHVDALLPRLDAEPGPVVSGVGSLRALLEYARARRRGDLAAMTEVQVPQVVETSFTRCSPLPEAEPTEPVYVVLRAPVGLQRRCLSVIGSECEPIPVDSEEIRLFACRSP